MVPHGGLASRVKEIAHDAGSKTRVHAFTLKDEFIHHYGDHAQLLAAHGLDVETIHARIVALVRGFLGPRLVGDVRGASLLSADEGVTLLADP